MPKLVVVALLIGEQTFFLQTLEGSGIGDQLLFQAFFHRRAGEGGRGAGRSLDAMAAAGGFQIRVGGRTGKCSKAGAKTQFIN